MTDAGYASNDISAPRLVWDPVAHEVYDEHCVYFLLRLRDPDPAGLSMVEELLHRAYIRCACVYSLWGYHDVLLRVWATGQKRRRLVRVLSEEGERIDEVEEFQARQIRYLWAERQGLADASRARKHMHQIRDVVLAKQEGERQTGDEGKLEKLGLLHIVPGYSGDVIKFYIALSRATGATRKRDEMDQLVEALATEPDSGESWRPQNISVYGGIGFADYLVKMVVREYAHVARAAQLLDPVISRLELRPTTHLIANGDAREEEDIDVTWEEFDPSLMNLEEVLGRASSKYLSELTATERHELGSLFDKYSDLRDTPFDPYFKGLFMARVEADPVIFAEKLSFLTHLESLLRRALPRTLAEIWGRDTWHARLERLLEAMDTNETPTKPDDWDLRDVHAVMAASAKEDRQVAGKFVELYGQGWDGLIRRIAAIRNDVTHGRVYERETYEEYWRDWQNVADVLFRAGQLYATLIAEFTSGDVRSTNGEFVDGR